MSERGSSASWGRSISPAPHSDYEYDERHRSSRAVERTTRSISPESRTPPTRSPRRSLSRSLSPRRHGRRESPERSRDYYDDEDDDYRYRHKRSRSPREGHYHHRYRSRSRSLSRSRRSSRNTARVYFGNLSYDCRKSDLKELAREGRSWTLVGIVNVLVTAKTDLQLARSYRSKYWKPQVANQKDAGMDHFLFFHMPHWGSLL